MDECLPRILKRELPEHEVWTVPRMGWAGKKNGELLRLAEPLFDVFLTIDQNLRHQQNVREFDLAFVLLTAKGNDIETLRPLVPELTQALRSVQPGTVTRVG